MDVSDPLEWIARITSHIPRKGAKQVIYYRSYSQAWGGRERRQGILPKAPNEEEPASMKDRSSYSSRRRQMWAVLLMKVWDVDALKSPKCGGEMKVISFIEQPFVIRRILKHLDLWEYPRPPPKPLELVCEPDADYIPWQDDAPEIEVGWEFTDRASVGRCALMRSFEGLSAGHFIDGENYGAYCQF